MVRKVAFELVFGTALVNSYLIYKEKYTKSKVTILQFRESLVQSLLLDTPIEKLRHGPRQQSASSSKHKLTDHKLQEIEASTRDVRRRCAGCYEKIRQQQSKEASNATAKKIKTFCSDCDKFFCLDCFNEKHYAAEVCDPRVQPREARGATWYGARGDENFHNCSGPGSTGFV